MIILIVGIYLLIGVIFGNWIFKPKDDLYIFCFICTIVLWLPLVIDCGLEWLSEHR